MRGSHIQALFVENNSEHTAAFPSQVLYYFEHDLRIPGNIVTHTFAFIRWYNIHRGSQPLSAAGIDVWKSSFRPLDMGAILPVQRILSPIAVAKYESSNLLAVIPIQKKSHA